MTLRKGLPAKLASTDADDTRYVFKNDVVCNADGSPRGGVTGPLTALLSSTATMNTAVAPFAAVAVRDGGVVKLANDGTVNVLHDAAPASNSRIDIIWAKQDDASSTVASPDADNNPVFGIAKGTAAPSPTPPTGLVPAGAVEIGRVQIPSTATATNSSGVVISSTSQLTASSGGYVPFRTVADLAGWTTARIGAHANVFADPTSAFNGDYTFDGSAWSYRDIAVATLTPGPNWTSGTSGNTPRIQMHGKRVTLEGTMGFGAGASYSNLTTIPSAFLPSNTRFAGTASQVTSTSLLQFMTLLTVPGGVLSQTSGASGSLPGSGAVYLHGLGWWMD